MRLPRLSLSAPRVPIGSRRSLLALGLAALTSALFACGGESGPAPLRFTAIPSESRSELEAKFQPLAEHLSEQLGLPVEFVPATDYAASVELFAAGDVELAWFGGLTGVQARRAVPGAEAIAQGRSDRAYKSYFIARRDADLVPTETFPLGLADLDFTFGSPGSTSGRMMPEHFIREATGQSPEEFFGSPMRFSGSHDLTWQAVQSGAAQAGVLDYKVFERDLASGDIDPLTVAVVWATPNYPDYNWTAHPAIDERFGSGTIERLAEALVALEDEQLLAALNRPEGLVPAATEDFVALEALALELDLVR